MLLCDAELMVPVGDGTYRITAAGHDFLEAVRDRGIWRKTKEAMVETGGSATLEIIKAIALGFVKKQISERTGIAL